MKITKRKLPVIGVFLISTVLSIIFWPISDNGVFWQAVEAIAVVIGLLAIFFQIEGYLQSQTETKIRRYILSMETIFNSDFFAFGERIKVAWKADTAEAASFFSGDVTHIIARLVLAQTLIEKNYLDKDLLFLTIGTDLYDIALAFQNFEATDKIPGIKNIKARDEKAFMLMEDVKIWFRNKNKF